jgi:hypothetical protein
VGFQKKLAPGQEYSSIKHSVISVGDRRPAFASDIGDGKWHGVASESEHKSAHDVSSGEHRE